MITHKFCRKGHILENPVEYCTVSVEAEKDGGKGPLALPYYGHFLSKRDNPVEDNECWYLSMKNELKDVILGNKPVALSVI